MKLIVACLLAITLQPNAEAVLAGGCFWCLEEAMEKVPGVISAVSGYTGGRIKNPTYEQVSSGGTGHIEAVRITYDPSKVTYAQLLEAFWRNIDPLDDGGQFCDRGEQYRAAIFVGNAAERATAEQSKRAIEASGKLKQRVVTAIHSAAPFYEAEAYHQDYYKKNPVRYRFYKLSCGRASRLDAIWGSTK